MSILSTSFICNRLVASVKSFIGIYENVCATSVSIQLLQTREMSRFKRRKTAPFYYWVNKRSKFAEQHLTKANESFVKDYIGDKYSMTTGQSLLKDAPWSKGEWSEGTLRTGVIARKIGIYPMWTKKGVRHSATLLQIVDNHVIKYIPPEVYATRVGGRRYGGKIGCLVVGAESSDPQLYTPAYNGLFTEAGVLPKEKLTRFIISPNAAIQPGTPLTVGQYRVGDYVDVWGKTIDYGFQGVMIRWKMRGGPKTHGCTKAHRRVGSIGTGRRMARVWPGKKMPGHMGSEKRVLRGLKILRINTKYNVMWVMGPAVPGAVHSYCYIMDSRDKEKRRPPPYFPTYYPEDHAEPLPVEMWDSEFHEFSDETLTFPDDPEIIIEPPKSKDRRR
ncbi:54S ribosomal protein L3 [Chamberlinius hualienensis]